MLHSSDMHGLRKNELERGCLPPHCLREGSVQELGLLHEDPSPAPLSQQCDWDHSQAKGQRAQESALWRSHSTYCSFRVLCRWCEDWSSSVIADVVIVLNRKTYSKHPPPELWPNNAIDAIRQKLQENGELAVYDAANRKLDQRLQVLRNKGKDIDHELHMLQMLRSNVSEVCIFSIAINNFDFDLALLLK